MHVTISKEAIKFSRVIWRSVLTLPGKHKKTFACLGGLRGQHNCVVACFNAKGKHMYPRSQWPHGGSAADCLLVLRARIPPGAWTFDFRDCCVLWVERSLRRADQFSRGVLSNVVCLTECDLETSTTRGLVPIGLSSLEEIAHVLVALIFRNLQLCS